MNDLSDRFMERGETFYAAIVDSTSCRAGYNRILMEFFIKSLKIETVRVYWNNNEDSIDVHIGSNSGYYSVWLNNLPEDAYLFTLVSFDKKGNRSLKSEVEGFSVGSDFLANVRNRIISSALRDETLTGTITWGDATENLVYSEVRYKTNSGTRTERISADTTKLICPDIKPGEVFEYRSVFLPANGADSIAGEWMTYDTPFLYKYPRTGWTAEARNGNHPWGAMGGEPDKMFDGLPNTGWHSLATAPLPQCIVVDMKESKKIHHIELLGAQTLDVVFYKHIQVFVSEMPITPDVYQPEWGTPVADVELTPTTLLCTIPLAEGSAGRYTVVYFLTSKTNTYISCMEFDVFGF
jgi:hypothetical protein